MKVRKWQVHTEHTRADGKVAFGFGVGDTPEEALAHAEARFNLLEEARLRPRHVPKPVKRERPKYLGLSLADLGL